MCSSDLPSFFLQCLQGHGYNAAAAYFRRVPLDEIELLLFPINAHSHWGLLAVDLRTRKASVYNSLTGISFSPIPADIAQFVVQLYKNKNIRTLVLIQDTPDDVPQQNNCYDCGVFVCKFAEFLSRDTPFTFSQEHMNYYRQRMIWEIVTSTVLPS